ncbi:MAG: hypothetical protein OEU36_11150 [Gammaproteobacteria bacterium]|nr:hypothetical protein [Gammaproteobacteria bacterium]
MMKANLGMCAEPIRNPVTGAEHHAQIVLPKGFEFRVAEMSSGRFKGMNKFTYENNNWCGSMWYAQYGPEGVID